MSSMSTSAFVVLQQKVHTEKQLNSGFNMLIGFIYITILSEVLGLAIWNCIFLVSQNLRCVRSIQ